MSYYMRFFLESEGPISLDEILTGIQKVDGSFRVMGEGDLYRGEQLLAQLEINERGSELFDEEIDEFLEMLEDCEDAAARSHVQGRLRKARATVAAQVLWQGRTPDETLELLAPLWAWLGHNRAGLLQADGEGFYDGDELILELE